jgi:Holliday junction resolvasome RuvABC endonuclease subunit
VIQPKRKPIVLQKKEWTTARHLVVMGVDPGFASSGVVILERISPEVMPVAVAAKVVATKKADKKLRSTLRVSADDLRRYRETWNEMCLFYDEFHPHALGVEVYQPGFRSKKFKGKQGGVGGTAGAVKSMGVYGGMIFWALTLKMFVSSFLPSDLKKRFCGRQSASKREIISEMCQLIVGLEELLASVPKSKREHVADAAGHAYLVLEEIDRMKVMLGLGLA